MDDFIQRLLQACRLRNWEDMENLIQELGDRRELGWAFMAPPSNLNDVLIWAAQEGHLAVVNQILEAEDVDLTAGKNEAIIQAAGRGHLDVVNALLARGVSITAKGNLALRLAARNGHLDVLNSLIGAGADLSVAPEHGLNAICIAAEQGNLAVVNRLLEFEGVDATAKKNYALRWAAERGHLDVASRLLRERAVIDAGVPESVFTCFETNDSLDLLCSAMFENPALRQHMKAKHLKLYNKLQGIQVAGRGFYQKGVPRDIVIKILADTIDGPRAHDSATTIFDNNLREQVRWLTAYRAKQQGPEQGEASPMPAGAPVTPAREAAGARRPDRRSELVKAQAASSDEDKRPRQEQDDLDSGRASKRRNRGESPEPESRNRGCVIS